MRQRVLMLGFVLFMSVGVTPVIAGGHACSGVLFQDNNQNGQQDQAEPGLPGIAVSDGLRLVRSDQHGRYRLPAASSRSVFVIKPAGYRLQVRINGLPDYWQNHAPSAPPTLRYGGMTGGNGVDCRDYPLLPEPAQNKDLEVLVFGDPQPKNLTDVDYYRRDIVAPLLAEPVATRAQLGLTLGDVSTDDLSLYPAINAVTATLGVPWLHVAGNHDLDFDAVSDDDSLLSFRNQYGPDTFAWEEAQASFIVLDDVIYQPGQVPSYIGGLRESQFTFLKSYLATARRDRLVVLAVHIPLFNPNPLVETFRRADRERLFRLLADFPHVLLLSAHSHEQSHYFHTRAEGWLGTEPLHEYNVGASCGAFWSGVADAEGIPDSTMSDGTPNGFARLRVATGGEYALRWQVARDPVLDKGIALTAPAVLRQGTFPAFGVYANVFMGDASSVVEFRVDANDWQLMQRVEQADPRLLAENIADNQAQHLRGFDRSPEATRSRHLWRGVLPTDLSAGKHQVEVRTMDRWRGELSAVTHYQLVEPVSANH